MMPYFKKKKKLMMLYLIDSWLRFSKELKARTRGIKSKKFVKTAHNMIRP